MQESQHRCLGDRLSGTLYVSQARLGSAPLKQIPPKVACPSLLSGPVEIELEPVRGAIVRALRFSMAHDCEERQVQDWLKRQRHGREEGADSVHGAGIRRGSTSVSGQHSRVDTVDRATT
jgi:hypothetical protein